MGSNFIVLAIFLSMLTLIILKKKLTEKEADNHE
jgi:branched-chain amino acid transporter azlC